MQNAATAAKWLESTANWGLAEAQYELGSLLVQGLGVTRDYDRALAWFEKVVAQGDARCR